MSEPLAPPLRLDVRGMARGFWEGAARGELRLPRCADCGTMSWPPRSHCPSCASANIDWVVSAGRGIVHTFTIVRQTADPRFAAKLPYAVAMIDLEEGVRVMSNVVGCDVDRVRIGMRVSATFADAGDGLALPVFTPVEAPR